ncbi:glycosyltransferase [Actinocatenispora rupis]|uniref:Glycosyl transferase family 2 n=1 Tax=Actinocatenispora rupis TaxID=519421 RepID=A0A8J3NC41_9ACTN|nr:glycosyl transferase family 2 [Actinocatenispora rupis]
MSNERRAARMRTVRAVILLVVTVVALAAWVWLAVARGGYWRTDQRLPAATPPERWPDLAVVVPARDEAAVLAATVPALVHQEYPGVARVVLVDDGSTDGTADVARTLAAGAPLPLTVVEPGEPPPGWTGKLWALHAGVRAAGDAELFLFTDADIAHRPGSLRALVTAAGSRDLVSQMARLRVETGWERLVVPAFVYFFALLYPFRWVNRPGARTAAAAGGCVLVRRAALDAAGGIPAVRDAVIDDVALGRAVKRAGGRIWLGLGDLVHSVRPYPGLGPLWRMVSRSAFPQLHYSVPLLAGTVLGLALLFLVPPAAVVAGLVTASTATLVLGGAGWLLSAALFLPMLRYYRQPAPLAVLLPLIATLYGAMTVDSALQYARGRNAAWKGRTYPRT